MNQVQAFFVPTTGILVVQHLFADQGPCAVRIAGDGQGSLVVTADNQETQINGQSAPVVIGAAGVQQVNVALLNTPHVLTVDAPGLPGVTLNLTDGTRKAAYACGFTGLVHERTSVGGHQAMRTLILD